MEDYFDKLVAVDEVASDWHIDLAGEELAGTVLVDDYLADIGLEDIALVAFADTELAGNLLVDIDLVVDNLVDIGVVGIDFVEDGTVLVVDGIALVEMVPGTDLAEDGFAEGLDIDIVPAVVHDVEFHLDVAVIK